jgi:hypothetical protein
MTYKVRIIVVAHKPFIPPQGDIFLPVHAGAANAQSIGFQSDATGDNISQKNNSFCELTGLYWAWKNLLDAEAIGLCHYRRLFNATPKRIAEILENYDSILPKPRNYFIETTYSQYAHAHHAIDLDTTREIIAERYPDCLEAFDATMKSTKGHRFNMLVMKRPLLDRYCTWLFDILFELEKRLDISGYSAYDRRVFGFVGERLLDVWIRANDIPYAELPVLHTESQHWPTKIVRFLKRKFLPARK